MKLSNTLSKFFIISLVVGTLLGCQRLGLTKDQTQSVPSTPGAAVTAFYSWYLSLDTNPIASGSYKTSELLSESFKESVALQVAASDQGGYDPIICAQDLPTNFQVGEAELVGDTANLEVTFTFGEQTLQVPLTAVRQAEAWEIDSVNCANRQSGEVARSTQTAIVYFSNQARQSAGETDCGIVYGVERLIPRTATLEASLAQKLNQLFGGPTDLEKQQGYSSFFDDSTRSLLNRVEVSGTTAYVDLIDIRNLIPNASSSCGSAQLLSSIEETVKHDRQIQKVIIAINGDPATFYDWIQIGCAPENNYCDPGPLSQ